MTYSNAFIFVSGSSNFSRKSGILEIITHPEENNSLSQGMCENRRFCHVFKKIKLFKKIKFE